MLRSSGRDEAIGRLHEELLALFSDQFAKRLAGPDAGVRAELLMAWMLGTSLVRTTFPDSKLAAAPEGTLERYMRAGVEVLIGPPPGDSRDAPCDDGN
ncbi:hypothetical protein NKH77_32130 [Streptomyces sp. M19]